MRFCMAVKTSPAGKDVSNIFSKTAPKKQIKNTKYKRFTQLQKFSKITFLDELYKHKTYNIQAEKLLFNLVHPSTGYSVW